MLPACESLTAQSRVVQIRLSEADLQACKQLALLKDGSETEVVKWGVATVLDYNDCASRAEKLAEAYRAAEKLKQDAAEKKFFWQ